VSQTLIFVKLQYNSPEFPAALNISDSTAPTTFSPFHTYYVYRGR